MLHESVRRPRNERELYALSPPNAEALRRALGDLRLERGELRFAGGHVSLAALDGGPLELDRTEVLPTACDLRFRLRDLGLALRQIAQEVGELVLTSLEVVSSEPEHPLDRGARVAQQLLPFLQIGDRRVESRRRLVQLPAALGEERLETLLGSRPGRQHPTHEPAAARLPLVPGDSGLLCSRRHRVRRRTDPKPSSSEQSTGRIATSAKSASLLRGQPAEGG